MSAFTVQRNTGSVSTTPNKKPSIKTKKNPRNYTTTVIAFVNVFFGIK